MKRIRRNQKGTGWFISSLVTYVSHRKFYDKEHGGPERAYQAAQKELDDHAPARKIETRVRSNKKSLDIVGITYYTVKDGNQIKHRFAVCNPGTGRPQMVHIGNDNTYTKNWERKLAEAEALRERFMQEHRDKHL